MKKIHYLFILLTLALASPCAMAQLTGGQFKVDGDTITWDGQPESTEPGVGDTISTTDIGHAVSVINSGSYAGADGWNIESRGGIYVQSTAGQNSFFSGSNLTMTILKTQGNGVFSWGVGSKIVLDSCTFEMDLTMGGSGIYAYEGAAVEIDNTSIVTSGSKTLGITINHGSSVTITDSSFVLDNISIESGPLPTLIYVDGTGTNNVTLTNVTADIVGDKGYLLETGTTYLVSMIPLVDAPISAVTTLNINDSTLSGDILVQGETKNTVNLRDHTTITGNAITRDDAKLTMNIDSTSKWNATGTLNVITNLSLEAGAVVDIGIGMFNQLVVLDTLTFELVGTNFSGQINGYHFYAPEDMTVALDFGAGFYVEGFHSYDLFSVELLNVQGGDFLSLLDYTLAAGWTIENLAFADGTLSFDLLDLRRDVPEPGTWALMLGGLGVLGYLQRARRNRK